MTILVSFNEAIEDVSRGNSKLPQTSFLSDGLYPVVDQGQQLVAGFANDASLLCKVPGPVIVFGDHTRALKFVDFRFIMGADGVKVLRVRNGWDPKFVFHYLKSCDIPSAGYSRHFKFLKQVSIPKPPLAEQRRVAAILDRADDLSAKRRQSLAHLDELTQSVFLEMFGDPVRNDRAWPLRAFGEVCETRLGKMLDAKQQTGDHPRPYLRNANVQWFRVDLENVLEMDFDEKSRATHRLKNGDVMICEGGRPGRAAIWRHELEECYFQKALHRARPNPDLAHPEFVVHLMWFLVHRGGLKDHVTSATISHLTGAKLKAMPIILPGVDVQDAFAQRLAKVDELRTSVERSLCALTALTESLKSRAFRGDL